jgi:hypothetical protein
MSDPQRKFEVVIERISRKHNHGFRYRITVYWDRAKDQGSLGWSYTLWGAHRKAVELVHEHFVSETAPVVVEEYQL